MEPMKAKMSVTVEKDLVEWIKREVKTQRFRNKSHAVEVALRKYIEQDKDKKE